MKETTYKKQASDALDVLRENVALDLQKVDALIYSLIENKINLIPQISTHTILSGGKRLRPMLTLATAALCGYQGSAHIELAASVEFIHTATLLHDDVVDKSNMRRGVYTANELWGNKESILVGDYLLGKAFELMQGANSLEVYKVLSNAAVVISEGEVRQLELIARLDIQEEEYFSVINAKTAALFAAACEVGAIISSALEPEIKALREYGSALGTAFQIIDDVLDYVARPDALGKNIGDDFREKKVTLPVILAYRKASVAEREFWLECYDSKNIIDEDQLVKAINLVNKTGSIDAAVAVAEAITLKAKQELELFPDSKMRTILSNILDFVVRRGF